ncbi:MAG: AI-2E family transporter [Actinobacteria bacterium]|nr:AI-2E family transporter [Actinomycetota bacterium]
MSDIQSTPVDASGKMPKWVIKAIALFWLGFLATYLVRNTVQKLSSIALLLLVATFITLALEPAVNRLSARGMKRGSATALLLVSLVVATLGFVAAMGTIVAQQVADLLANSEQYVNDTVKIINDIGNSHIDPAEVNASISDPNGPVQKFILGQRDNAFKVSVQAVGALFQGFSVLLFAFYLVADGPRLRRVICSRLRPERQRGVLDAWELAITKTGGFLYSRALLAVLSAFFHWILLQSVGAPAPIAMALWVGLISQFLPVIGTYLAGVLPVLLTFIESPTKALIILVFILVYQQVENYLFSPRITARTLELHPALAFGGALAGAAVLGPIGALLALPAVAMGQALISAWGVRHDVIDDPLTHIAPTKVRVKKTKKNKVS